MPKIRVMGFGILDLACVPVPGQSIEVDGSVLDVARTILHADPKRDKEKRLIVATVELATDSGLVMVESLNQDSVRNHTSEPRIDLSGRDRCEASLKKYFKKPNLKILSSKYSPEADTWQFDVKFPGSDAIEVFTVHSQNLIVGHQPTPLPGN